MSNPAETINWLYQHENIENDILNKLKELRQQYPEHFRKPIHVLATVHDNMDAEWKQRLQQAKEQRNGEYFIIIPYKVSNIHWIGVLIKFKADGQVERAEFIDPFGTSNLDVNKLQKQFADVYPGIILQARNVQKQDNRKKNAELIIGNLLKAIEEYQLTNINDSQDKTIENPEGNNENNQYLVQTSSMKLQNQSKSLIEIPQVEQQSGSWSDEKSVITEESLRNMQKDFRSMPSCSEKSIICLLYYLSLKLISNPIALDNNIVQKEFEYLKERLKIEELESKEIRNLLEEISINIKYENWKHSLISMKKIFKKISPLNIHELFRLIKKVNNTAHTIKNKDIIFFLGGTGSGKSTTIHFLAGSKMIENKVTGLNHLSLVEINNPDLKHITTSPFARSETRYITSVKVNFDDVGRFTRESIILCDSPGFEDTSGPEVDIANGLGIVNVIKGCKSVKPVVIISYKSIGDRLQGLKDLMYVLSALIPGIQDQIEAFSYIFTKFPEKERDTIHALINDINENLKEEEKSDRSFTILLKDILKKTRKCARVLDPINDKPGKILDELAKSPAIHHPEEVFQFSITKKSKAILREQITKHQLNIRSATERSDYDFVKYRLDQLKHLNDLFSQDYIEQIYNECLRYIRRHLFEEYEKGILAMKRYLMNQTSLNAEDIRQYQACMYHAKLAKEVRENHLGMDVVDSTAFIENLKQQLNMILKDLKEKDIDDMSIKVSLDKLKIVSNVFSDIDSKKYDDICQFFIEKLDSLVDLFKISVS
ncbi:unnamed protein product [Rotaria sp. Silwood2]|nr:unnamed protein product [Rotaria sp. Silwood2]